MRAALERIAAAINALSTAKVDAAEAPVEVAPDVWVRICRERVTRAGTARRVRRIIVTRDQAYRGVATRDAWLDLILDDGINAKELAGATALGAGNLTAIAVYLGGL